VTGNDQDPYNDDVRVDFGFGEHRLPPMQRPAIVLCVLIAGLAVGAWMLTQILTT
jgi:hypothetical protein